MGCARRHSQVTTAGLVYQKLPLRVSSLMPTMPTRHLPLSPPAASNIFRSAGIGILMGAVYRVVVMNEPQADLMGILGVIGLAINVTATIILLRHRHGDSNVRAVWLFSRNDAIGNVAVVIAAGLLAWTNTHWLDLLVAVVLAGLFLQSAWAIGRDARQELSGLNAR